MRPQAYKFFEGLKNLEILHYDDSSLIKTLNYAKSTGYIEWWESKKKEKEFWNLSKIIVKDPNTKFLRYSNLLKG